MTDYERGYKQAMQDINTPMDVIIEEWEPSRCPRCGGYFDEDCNDGYYLRALSLKQCPHCCQRLRWPED